MKTADFAHLPSLRFLPWFYRSLLGLTRRRGMHTLARWHDRLFPSGQIVRLPDGPDLYLPRDPHFFGFLSGIHEQHIALLINERVRPGSLCVDVGANIGYFSALMAHRCGTSGHVFAYEPVAENFEILRINAERLARERLTIIPRHAAVSKEKGTLSIQLREQSTHHQVGPADTNSAAATLIPAVSLDDEFAGNDSIIDLLKVDVEGFEWSVIQGAQRLLAEGRIRAAVVEVLPGPEAETLVAFLRSKARSSAIWTGSWSPLDRLPGYGTDALFIFRD